MLRERTIDEPLRGAARGSLTPLVGRDEELALLMRRWEQIKDGEGRVVLLAGEAGIGKSRLSAALEERLKANRMPACVISAQPHHQDSALQPIVAQFQHAAGFAATTRRPTSAPSSKRCWRRRPTTARTSPTLFADLLGCLAQAAVRPTADRSASARSSSPR